MESVNGIQLGTTLELTEVLSRNNYVILEKPSNQKWELETIRLLIALAHQQKLVLYLPVGTSDAQTLTDDKNAQKELTNGSDDDKNSKHGYCAYCKHQLEPLTSEKCIHCVNSHAYEPYATDNWEAK